MGWGGVGCGVVWCGVVWCGVVWCGVVWCGVVWCGVVWCGVVWCGVVWCGVVWCGVVWCGVVWCGVVWCGVVWCGVVWCGVVWCGVVWCGVVWCGVVWCGVVWCGVVWCGVVWCGVVWCGVVWCGVVWCGVVWCGVRSVVKLFADDVKLIGDANDSANIQEDLDNSSIWKNDWCIEFNVEKCTVMHIGESNTRKRYHLEGNELMAVTTEKDLAVNFSESFGWSQHVEQSIGKAKTKSFDVLLPLYKSMIRTHLEYCVVTTSAVWKLENYNGFGKLPTKIYEVD